MQSSMLLRTLSYEVGASMVQYTEQQVLRCRRRA